VAVAGVSFGFSRIFPASAAGADSAGSGAADGASGGGLAGAAGGFDGFAAGAASPSGGFKRGLSRNESGGGDCSSLMRASKQLFLSGAKSKNDEVSAPSTALRRRHARKKGN
jgi:hypothetical protein